jgi:hypothetical protein
MVVAGSAGRRWLRRRSVRSWTRMAAEILGHSHRAPTRRIGVDSSVQDLAHECALEERTTSLCSKILSVVGARLNFMEIALMVDALKEIIRRTSVPETTPAADCAPVLLRRY